MTEEEAKKEMKHFLLGLTVDAREEIKFRNLDELLEETQRKCAEELNKYPKLHLSDLDKYSSEG